VQLSDIPVVVTWIPRVINSLSNTSSLLLRITKSPDYKLFLSNPDFSFLTGNIGSPKLSNLNKVYFLIISSPVIPKDLQIYSFA